ncbi:MAG: hypothetical protein Q8Q01_00370 [archaeon]|nr:hypothetical protein [archaeon]
MELINDMYDVMKFFCQGHEIELERRNTAVANRLRFLANKGPISLFASICPDQEMLSAKRVVNLKENLFRESIVYFKREENHSDYSAQVWVANAAVADYVNQLDRILHEEVDGENYESFILVSEIHDQLKEHHTNCKGEIIKYPETQVYVSGEQRTPALDCLLLLASFYPWSSGQ